MKTITIIKDKDSFESNPDKEFMISCGEIDRNPPSEWRNHNIMDILDMEFSKLKEMYNTASTIKAFDTQIYRLSVACLHLWRMNH
jgi:hypothetical protein